MKVVEVLVVQELACSHIEELVDFSRSPRGRLQHHGCMTEDGLKSIKMVAIEILQLVTVIKLSRLWRF